MNTHSMFDDRLQVYKRDNSRFWQCSARVGGQRFRQSTGQESLEQARDWAEDWYLSLRGQARRGEIQPTERTFGDAAKQYLREVQLLTPIRNVRYAAEAEERLNRHILPYFRDKGLSKINRGLVQEFRLHRHEESIKRRGKPPSRSTMLKDLVVIRQVLKCAEGHGWVAFVPDFSAPYKTQGKFERRPWFSPAEYKKLYQATRRRIDDGTRRGWKSHYEDMHDYVLFMGNSGLRPDEAQRVQIRDVTVEHDPTTKKDILVMDVRGKRGVRYTKTMPGAVFPFQRLKARRAAEAAKTLLDGKPGELQPTDLLFRPFNRDLFNQILREEELKEDRDGKLRTAYSLRHYYISQRIMEGANIHAVANNCGTSVEMIEKFYAAHIRDFIDTALINVAKPRRRRQQEPELIAAE